MIVNNINTGDKMNIEILLIVGLVLFMFLLIQVAKMRSKETVLSSQENEIIPSSSAFIENEINSTVPDISMESYKTEKKLIDAN